MSWDEEWTFPTGPYQGKPVSAAPTDYLQDVLRRFENCYDADKWASAARELIDQEVVERGLFGEHPSDGQANLSAQQASNCDPTVSAPTELSRLLQEVYRDLALRYHPDRAGSTAMMQAINDAFEQLRTALKVDGYVPEDGVPF
jgi:hypothetical protein